jgi:hypothetical protein
MVVFDVRKLRGAISNNHSLASNIEAARRGWSRSTKLNKALIWMSSMLGSHWRYLLNKKVKSWDTTTSLKKIHNFEPQLESDIFKCISWLTRFFFFWCDDRGCLKGGAKTFQMTPMSTLQLANIFLSLHTVYSLWFKRLLLVANCTKYCKSILPFFVLRPRGNENFIYYRCVWIMGNSRGSNSSFSDSCPIYSNSYLLDITKFKS